MKNYTKVHKTRRVADIHLAKIEKRGGIATTKEVPGGIQIDYHFPDKKTQPAEKEPAKKAVLYDLLSPDGISIRMGDHDLFKNFDEVRAYFDKWKKRFERQGYYSSSYGRISLENLADSCDLIEVEQ